MRITVKPFMIAVTLALVVVAVTQAGSLTVSEASLTPSGQAFELNRSAAGDLYISDYVAEEIWKVTAGGAYTVYSVESAVIDALADAAGNIWWTDSYNLFGRVNTTANPVTETRWTIASANQLWGLEFDAQGRVWLTQEYGDGEPVYRFDPSTSSLCTYNSLAPSEYILIRDGYVWMANWSADRVYRLDPASGQVQYWDIPGDDPWPIGVVFDGSGNLWWADLGLESLVRLEPALNRATVYALPLGTYPEMLILKEGKFWYTEDVLGTVGILDPAVAVGASSTVATGSFTVTSSCATISGSTSSISTRSGSFSWSDSVVDPSYDAGGWTIYELRVGSMPWGIADGGDAAYVVDSGRQKLLRLTPAPVTNPDLDLEKYVNGLDSDSAPGLYVTVDGALTWTYVITNTGDVALADVTVVDDNGTPAVLSDDYTCVIGSLAVDAADSTTCSQTGSAVAGQFVNTAVATGTPPAGADATDSDPAYYFGVDAAVALVKKTNGADANNPPGPSIAVGETVNWTYEVTNAGNVPLTAVAVTDDQGVTVTCPKTMLASAELMTCTASGIAVAGQYVNIGTATGTPPGGLPEVTDTDLSHYFGVGPGIALVKKTNGDDADTPPGPSIPVGETVTWTYEVTNSGNVMLTSVGVTDDQGIPVACPKSTLEPAEMMICYATGTAVAGQYVNIGTATGTPPVGAAISASDPSHYFGVAVTQDIYLYLPLTAMESTP